MRISSYYEKLKIDMKQQEDGTKVGEEKAKTKKEEEEKKVVPDEEIDKDRCTSSQGAADRSHCLSRSR